MKKILISLFFLSASLGASGAGRASVEEGVHVVETQAVREGDDVVVRYNARARRGAMPYDHTLVLAPMIVRGEWRQSLTPVIIEGPGSMVARERREWVAGQEVTCPGARRLHANARAYRGGRASRVASIVATVPFQEWMVGADVVLERVLGGCCTYDSLPAQTLARNILVEVPEVIEEPEPPTVGEALEEIFPFVLPAAEFDEENPISFEEDEKDNIVVHFRAGSSVIEPSYMTNEAALHDLTASVSMILSSSESLVDRVLVAGFTSPEGGSQINGPLALARAEAVRDYVAEHTGIRRGLIDVYNGEMAWDKLRVMVAASSMPKRDEVLSIIDNVPVWDRKTQTGRLGEIMRMEPEGTTYRYLLEEFFPSLRVGAYVRVYYNEATESIFETLPEGPEEVIPEPVPESEEVTPELGVEQASEFEPEPVPVPEEPIPEPVPEPEVKPEQIPIPEPDPVFESEVGTNQEVAL